MDHSDFAAIDFETCHTERDSACALGIARVRDGEIVAVQSWRIRPPFRDVWMFERIHGIKYSDVADAPWFAVVWTEAMGAIRGARHLAAHNAPFDQSVLAACCRRARIVTPGYPWLDSLTLSRRALPSLADHTLPTVCAALGVDIAEHHDPAHDARACAEVILRIGQRTGVMRCG